MKKIITLFIQAFLLLTIPLAYAQKNKSEFELDFHEEIYARFYPPDSVISKTVDQATVLPWQSKTFKSTSAALEVLGRNARIFKSSEGIAILLDFPKETSEDDCDLFITKNITYKIKNESNKKIYVPADRIQSFIGTYDSIGVPRRYVLWVKLMPVPVTQVYKGSVEYDIVAPAAFNYITITKADSGKVLSINNLQYTVINFSKNHVALKSNILVGQKDSQQNINFDYFGTDNADKKYMPKFNEEGGLMTALWRGNFTIPEDMYQYYINHPNLTQEELAIYVSEYAATHEVNTVPEKGILIIKDFSYIDKMFVFWPDSVLRKHIKVPFNMNRSQYGSNVLLK